MQFLRTPISGPSHRIINSRYPTVGVFDGYCDDEAELHIAFELEQATNPRLNETMSALARLPQGSILTGGQNDGASLAMSAFIHCSPPGGRFHDPSLGAWYSAMDQETAIAETIYHNERRIKLSAVKLPTVIQVRELVITLNHELLDLRGAEKRHPEFFETDDYQASQAYAQSIRWPDNDPGEDGLIYESVRNSGGTNICLFRPQAVPLPVRQGGHFQYDWDAKGEVAITKLTAV